MIGGKYLERIFFLLLHQRNELISENNCYCEPFSCVSGHGKSRDYIFMCSVYFKKYDLEMRFCEQHYVPEIVYIHYLHSRFWSVQFLIFFIMNCVIAVGRENIRRVTNFCEGRLLDS